MRVREEEEEEEVKATSPPSATASSAARFTSPTERTPSVSAPFALQSL